MTQSSTHQHPAWFGSVMGTGALAVALAEQAATFGWQWLSHAAVAFLMLTSVIALALLPR